MKRILFVLWGATLVGLLYAGGSGAQQQEVSTMKAEFDSLKSQFSSLRNEHSSLDSKVGWLNSSVEDLKREKDSIYSELEDLKSKLRNTIQQSDLDSMRTDLTNFQALWTKFQKRDLAALRKSDDDAARDLERLADMLANERKNADAMQRLFEGLQKTVDLHSARLEQVKKQTHIKMWVP